MGEFYDFASNHAFQALFMVACATWLTAEVVFRLSSQLLRTVKVLCRGWPPEHIDADGDFREASNGEVEVAEVNGQRGE